MPTVYRHVAELQRQGVPIEGEAGVAYRMDKEFDLPPLMFTQEEALAMAPATRLAQQWLDPALARAAGDALTRVVSALQEDLRAQMQSTSLVLPPAGLAPDVAACLQMLREAAQARTKVAVAYADAEGRYSERVLRPLG